MARSNGVGGSRYLVHNVRASNNARTVCGRLCATVNHSYDQRRVKSSARRACPMLSGTRR